MPDPSDSLRSFWNRWIEEYLEKHKPDQRSVRRGNEAIRMVRSLELKEPRILEVGCANGWFAAQLSQYGEVTGIDIADEVINRAKANIPEVEFIAGDFTRCGDLKGQFDIVVSLETIGNVADHDSFVSHLVAALKPRGHLILSCQNKFVFEHREDVSPPAPGQVRNWLNLRALRRLLRRKFRILRMYTIMPAGHRGILRIINSDRLDMIAQKTGIYHGLTRIREQLGLGQSILVHARLK